MSITANNCEAQSETLNRRQHSKRIPVRRDDALEEIEVQLLLEGVFRRYGFDFQDYALENVKERVRECLGQEGLKTVSAFQEKVLRDRKTLDRFIAAMSDSRGAQPQSGGLLRAVREEIVPLLRTYPSVRIWYAGCSSLHEIYGLAIILLEEGLQERAQMYVTDANEQLVAAAREGWLPGDTFEHAALAYKRSGGQRDFATYCMVEGREAMMHPALKAKLVFGQHHLTSDSSFNSFNLMLCRQQLRRFNPALLARAHHTLYESLEMFGVLGIGEADSLRFTPFEKCYEVLDAPNQLYRKIR